MQAWTNSWRYAFYGALFGTFFPSIATVIRVAQYESSENAVWHIIVNDPLFWIIATAPFFLGLFAYIAGVKQDATEQALHRLAEEQAATEQKVHDAIAIIQQQEEQARQKDAVMLAMTEQALEEISFAHKMQSEFLANLSHELRTPIASILAAIEILQEWVSSADARVFLDVMYRSGNALLRIINDLLDIVHLEAERLCARPEPTSIQDLVASVTNLFAVSILQKNLDIQVLLDGNLPAMVMIDGKRVRQILYNLVGNAVKFTEQGSVVVEVVWLAGSEHRRAHIQFIVRDTGVGMTAEFQRHLFEKFHQQDGSSTRLHGGLGIGLALVKGLVDVLGGTIEVWSEVDVGTCVTVALPVEDTGAEEKTQAYGVTT
ncbi:MAG: HAMP domain-containing histidine kinase [Candidatus Kapabacteria bacterium]|nr:HAMP domain-containing histidine kinase [Candidatus Kapabacteria bacterium]